ncbi:hypothetical protein COO60DRAFT_1666203 [Scenedesmus sp. NREL 46B-D3]|nr:hypothetical protein COO60DRAFT_1666203 [Scenedesmus sp. NREL 46B-D3]
MRLPAISSITLSGCTGMLAALPAHSLTHLDINELGHPVNDPAASAALARLTNLQRLRAQIYGGPYSCLAGVAQLTRLTWLEKLSRQAWQAVLNGVAASANLTKLRLEAGCWGDGDESEDGTRNTSCTKLAGLTKLKDLTICSRRDGPPSNVPGDALALTALTGLTCLALAHAGAGVGDEAAAALAGSCRQLRHLDLGYCSLVSMACLANVAHLTQLTTLRLAEQEVTKDVTDEVAESFWAAEQQQQQQP